MIAAVKAVLFDVDGTLMDTNYLHTIAWWEAFEQAGHQVPMAPIHRAVGMGSDRLLDALLPPDRDTSADDDITTAHAALDADDAIDAATSAGDAKSSKPAPDLVQVALKQAGAEPGESLFVGDAVWDARACQQAGVRCVGVLSGGSSREELTGAGAAAVYDGPADLLDHFPDWLSA